MHDLFHYYSWFVTFTNEATIKRHPCKYLINYFPMLSWLCGRHLITIYNFFILWERNLNFYDCWKLHVFQHHTLSKSILRSIMSFYHDFVNWARVNIWKLSIHTTYHQSYLSNQVFAFTLTLTHMSAILCSTVEWLSFEFAILCNVYDNTLSTMRKMIFQFLGLVWFFDIPQK